MTTLISPSLPRRMPLSVLLSVALHGSLIACVLYTSFHQAVELPEVFQPISVSIVAPVMQPAPQVPPASVAAPTAESRQPNVQPEQVPAETDPLPAESTPVVAPPVPIAKPKPKPVKKRVVKENNKKKIAETKPAPAPAKTAQTAPSAATPTQPSVGPKLSASPSPSVASGPQALSIGKPGYPARAYALRMEGKVRVQFDVNSEGRVDNIRILAAEPRNMFEHEVKQAMNKWRYERGKPGSNLIMNIVFRIDGGSQVE